MASFTRSGERRHIGKAYKRLGFPCIGNTLIIGFSSATVKHVVLKMLARYIALMNYDDSLTVREALQKYFVLSGFGVPNYDDKWVKVNLGPIPFVFPNTNARRRAVRFHDIHHVLTEYPTTLAGETKIGAWEIASGCGPHLPAWILNLLAFFIGIFINPYQAFRAFAHGRRSLNLFKSKYDEKLLSTKIGKLRVDLKISHPESKTTPLDALCFTGAMAISTIAAIIAATVFLSPLLLILMAWHYR